MKPTLQILAVAILAGVFPAQGKGAPGYLAMLGPSPLRFAKRVEASVVEPLPPAEKEVAPKEVVLPVAVDPPVTTAVETVPGKTPKMDELQPGGLVPAPAPPQDPSAVSPYQLLQYLLKPGSTNAVQPVVVVPPVNFAPPVQTAPRASSSATFQKGP